MSIGKVTYKGVTIHETRDNESGSWDIWEKIRVIKLCYMIIWYNVKKLILFVVFPICYKLKGDKAFFLCDYLI